MSLGIVVIAMLLWSDNGTNSSEKASTSSTNAFARYNVNRIGLMQSPCGDPISVINYFPILSPHLTTSETFSSEVIAFSAISLNAMTCSVVLRPFLYAACVTGV